jgi:hypothetical protein
MLRRGAYLLVGLVALGVDRTAGIVSWGVAGVEQAVMTATELPGSAWGAVRCYLARLESTARWRARYRRIIGPLGARYRALRRTW